MTADLIGARTAADILGVAVPTVSRYVADGILTPVAKLEGKSGAFVFDRMVVDRVGAELAAWKNAPALISAQETRKTLGISARQLLALVTGGDLVPAGRVLNTGSVLFHVTDVEAFR